MPFTLFLFISPFFRYYTSNSPRRIFDIVFVSGNKVYKNMRNGLSCYFSNVQTYIKIFDVKSFPNQFFNKIEHKDTSGLLTKCQGKIVLTMPFGNNQSMPVGDRIFICILPCSTYCKMEMNQ